LISISPSNSILNYSSDCSCHFISGCVGDADVESGSGKEKEGKVKEMRDKDESLRRIGNLKERTHPVLSLVIPSTFSTAIRTSSGRSSFRPMILSRT